jgi:nickel-dependent lactate racemase
VNVTLNQNRDITAVFAGDRIQALNVGVEYAKEVYAVETYPDADVIIVDMYPFDISYQVASGRGFWPFHLAHTECSKILLAGCPEGLSSHDLFSVSDHVFDKVKHRIKNFRLSHLLTLGARLRTLQGMYLQRKMNVIVLSETLEEEDLKKALPGGKVITLWDNLLDMLIDKHGKSSKTTVAIYRCAPMMFPKKE